MENITAPPAIARGLLWLSVPAAERDSIPGDLAEEFSALLAAGATAADARSWYWRQVWRSGVPLLSARWRRAAVPENVLLALLAFAAPLRALDLLWAFVLSQVPLKVDAIRPQEFLLVSLAAACVLGFAAGAMRRRVDLWIGAAALLALATIPARLPLWDWVLLPLLASGAAALSNRRTEAS